MRIHLRTTIALLALVACTLVASTSQAATYNNLPVAFDRWMYPFNGTPGTRATGSIFGAVGEVGTFDDRDGQVLLGFDTSSIGGLAPGEKVTAATLTITIAVDEAFAFDGTYDDYTTYTGVDGDTGRPIELYGVGTRGSFASGPSLNGILPSPPYFLENSAYGFGDPTAESIRSAFASDYAGGLARDVSNNVTEGFNPNVWAVGQATGVTAGDLVPINTTMTFSLDLNNVDVKNYLSAGANAGELFFALTSLHPTSQQSSTGYPQLYLDANGQSLGATATLNLEVNAVPEPSSFALAGLGLAGLGLAGWRRRRSAR